MFRSIRFKLIVILLLFIICPKVSAMVEPTYYFYVNDYAEILSDDTEQYIINKKLKMSFFTSHGTIKV